MGFLLLSLEDLPGDIPGLVGLGPVELRLDLGFVPRSVAGASAASFENVGAHTLGFIRLDRARVGLFLSNSDSRESVQNFPALDFQLSR
jgi:hypothetical protein